MTLLHRGQVAHAALQVHDSLAMPGVSDRTLTMGGRYPSPSPLPGRRQTLFNGSILNVVVGVHPNRTIIGNIMEDTTNDGDCPPPRHDGRAAARRRCPTVSKPVTLDTPVWKRRGACWSRAAISGNHVAVDGRLRAGMGDLFDGVLQRPRGAANSRSTSGTSSTNMSRASSWTVAMRMPT